jgi:hypothetical protein
MCVVNQNNNLKSTSSNCTKKCSGENLERKHPMIKLISPTDTSHLSLLQQRLILPRNHINNRLDLPYAIMRLRAFFFAFIPSAQSEQVQ